MKLLLGSPPSTKQVLVVGDATTARTSPHATRNRSAWRERIAKPASSTTSVHRHIGDARYPAPSATPIPPVASGRSAPPSTASETTPSAPPVPSAANASPR